LEGLELEHIRTLAGCAGNVTFNAGDYIFRAGASSNDFYVLRDGKVALEIDTPGRGALIVQTLRAGDLLGWSAMVPPFKKQFDAQAVELTRAFSFDARCVLGKCEADPAFGYELLKRLAATVGQRLQATRMQLLDLYGNGR
jgi:CRP-like cAMP-binding protein